MSASPCIKASGFAGFALGCFLFSSVLTSGVSSSSPPLPYSVMREMAEWTSPFRVRVANRLFSFLSVIPRCLSSSGNLDWMVRASSSSSLMLPAFHKERHRARCSQNSLVPALACGFCNNRPGMTMIACIAMRSLGVLSLYARRRRVCSFTKSVPAWPVGGEKVFLRHKICSSYAFPISPQSVWLVTPLLPHWKGVNDMGLNVGWEGIISSGVAVILVLQFAGGSVAGGASPDNCWTFDVGSLFVFVLYRCMR